MRNRMRDLKQRFGVGSSVLLLLMAGLARSSVLCLGADGHASIEPVGAECCGIVETSNRAGSAPRYNLTAQSLGTSCGSCLDIPLATSTFLAPGSRQSTCEQPLLASWGIPTGCFVCLLPLVAPARHTTPLPEVAGAALSHRRTVVLRR